MKLLLELAEMGLTVNSEEAIEGLQNFLAHLHNDTTKSKSLNQILILWNNSYKSQPGLCRETTAQSDPQNIETDNVDLNVLKTEFNDDSTNRIAFGNSTVCINML